MSKMFFLIGVVLGLFFLVGCTSPESQVIDVPEDIDSLQSDTNLVKDFQYGDESNLDEQPTDDLIKDDEYDEYSVKDCGTIDAGEITSFSQYKSSLSCYLERAKECKPAKAKVKSVSDLAGEEILNFEVLYGNKDSCTYLMSAEKSSVLGIDISGKNISCTIGSQRYYDEFPSHNNYLFACYGSIADTLKELFNIETDYDYQFIKPLQYSYAYSNGRHSFYSGDNKYVISIMGIDTEKGLTPLEFEDKKDELIENYTTNATNDGLIGVNCNVLDTTGFISNSKGLLCRFKDSKENGFLMITLFTSQANFISMLTYPNNPIISETVEEEFIGFNKTKISFR